MSYRLRITADQQRVWDSLPPRAGEELTLALARVCDDPIATTLPYDGDEDGVLREIVLPSLVVVLLLVDATRNLHIMQITYLG
ncbi:hypothetical protein [Kitasatospora sp. NE20-6]|uniref:hypothetical protein n=1 Tax=Kitasatospora sp. NE20-6 TaxID=2859066 RepID=UPI0038B2A039